MAGVNDHGTPASGLNTTAAESTRTVPTRGDKPASTDAAVALVAKSATAPKILEIKGVVVAGGPLDDATIELVNKAAKDAINKRYIAYDATVKVGGSIAWRANNPGNLRYAPTQIGKVPGAVGSFAVFSTMDDGRAAQKSLYLTKYGEQKVRDAVAKLTPPEDQNDTAGYLKKLEDAGVDLDKQVKSQIDKLMPAIEANEGMIEGTELTRASSNQPK